MEPGTSQRYPVTGKGAQTGSVWVVEQGDTSPRQAGQSVPADTQTYQWLGASAKEVDWAISRDAFHPHLFCEENIQIYK